MLAVLLAATTGCGYAPVSNADELYEAVGLVVGDRALRRELADYLDDKGVDVANSAQLQLAVAGRETEDILSVTSTGTVNKLRLAYSVRLSMSRDGQQVHEEEFVLREVMTYNESRLLAKRKERRNIFRSMRANALDRIWARIRKEMKRG